MPATGGRGTGACQAEAWVAAAADKESRAAARGGPAQTRDASDIVGDPIGRDALLSELQSEMIPYTPEELIAIADKEMPGRESEMKEASRDLGIGDDWKKAFGGTLKTYTMRRANNPR